MFNFERLEVWQKAIVFAGLVYERTRAFPASECFGLTSQLRRAANSVASNIAEGASRPSADFAKFLGYACGSLYEVVTQMKIAENEDFLAKADYDHMYRQAEEISRMLSGLRRSLRH